MTAKHRHTHGRQQLVMEKVLGVGDANGQGAHADSFERTVSGNDDRCRWVELHGVFHPQLDLVDEVAVDEM